MSEPLSLTSYRLLGRSGLRVSPICLGAMTFGKEYAWGADEAEARRIFDLYVGRGGNFVDTANIYTGGTSERFVGAFSKGRRDRLVIATKYSMGVSPDDPNGSGNHRKNLMQSVHGSLQRLGTDSIDLLYLHGWDDRTPIEEILRGLDDLVSAGKVHYVGVSNTPAWQVARMQTLADLRGWAPLVAYQMEYSLLQREGEREIVPMCRTLGIGVMPWSPLGSGVLSGKYSRADLAGDGQQDVGSRKSLALMIGALSEHSLSIADAVKGVAEETGHTPAQVAIAWTLLNSAVAAPVIGVRTVAQLEDNLGALDVRLSTAQVERLEAASRIAMGYPHDLIAGPYQQMLLHGRFPTPPRT